MGPQGCHTALLRTHMAQLLSLAQVAAQHVTPSLHTLLQLKAAGRLHNSTALALLATGLDHYMDQL